MATDLKTLQAQANALTDLKGEDAERLKLNIQIEMLRIQKRIAKGPIVLVLSVYMKRRLAGFRITNSGTGQPG